MELNEFATLLNRTNNPTDYLARSGFARRYTQTSGSSFLRDPGYGRKIAHEAYGAVPSANNSQRPAPTFRAGVTRNYNAPWGGDMAFRPAPSFSGGGGSSNARNAGEMLGQAIAGYTTQRKRQKEAKAQAAASQAAIAQQRAREQYVSNLPVAPADFSQMFEPGPAMAPAPTYPMSWEEGPSPAPMDFAQMVEAGPAMGPAPTMGTPEEREAYEKRTPFAAVDFSEMVKPGPVMGPAPTKTPFEEREEYESTSPVSPMDFSQMGEAGPAMGPAPTKTPFQEREEYEKRTPFAAVDFSQMVEPGPVMAPAPTNPFQEDAFGASTSWGYGRQDVAPPSPPTEPKAAREPARRRKKKTNPDQISFDI